MVMETRARLDAKITGSKSVFTRSHHKDSLRASICKVWLHLSYICDMYGREDHFRASAQLAADARADTTSEATDWPRATPLHSTRTIRYHYKM